MIGFKTVVKGAIGVVAVVLVLVVSCPDEDSFNRWAKSNITPESGSVLEQAKGMALTAQAKWTADYEDHVLWATADAYQGGTRQRYVGAVGTWFHLSEREE